VIVACAKTGAAALLAAACGTELRLQRDERLRQIVPDGIREIVAKQRAGWGYIKVGH
jgi:intracellular sulfur oxidation DsrE/DsrF family protein